MREDLEQLLDGAVLAAGAVQGDEGDLGALGLQRRDQLGADVDRDAPRGRARASASSTRAPLRSDTWRSSPRPPLSTATFICARGGGTAPPSPRLTRPPPDAKREEAGGTCSPVIDLVQLDLLGDHAADPADALADLVRLRGREVEPHRRAAAPVDVGGRAGDEGDVLAQRLRQQVGGVDVGRAASPSRRARRRAATRSPRRGSRRRGHRASRRGARGRSRRGRRRTRASGPRRSTRGRSTGSGSRCRGRRPACRAPPSPSPAAGRRASRAGSRARGSSRRCRGRARSRRRRACTAARSARPRSAAARRGCPRPRSSSRSRASATRRRRRSADIVTPAGFWKVGTV